MKNSVVSKILTFVDKNAPTILTVCGVGGLIGTTVMAVRATPRAETLIFDEEDKKGEPLTKLETIKVAWKPYIPVVIMGAATASCIIAANSVNAKRNAALSAAYVLSETALTEYKSKVLEQVGEKKAEKIENEVSQNRVSNDPVTSKEVIITGKGATLCYDENSGRYFESSIEELQQIENRFNKRLMENMEFLTLNDLYYEMGLDPIELGEELGWDVASGLVDMRFGSTLATDGRPCVTVNFKVAPRYRYNHYDR